MRNATYPPRALRKRWRRQSARLARSVRQATVNLRQSQLALMAAQQGRDTARKLGIQGNEIVQSSRKLREQREREAARRLRYALAVLVGSLFVLAYSAWGVMR